MAELGKRYEPGKRGRKPAGHRVIGAIARDAAAAVGISQGAFANLARDGRFDAARYDDGSYDVDRCRELYMSQTRHHSGGAWSRLVRSEIESESAPSDEVEVCDDPETFESKIGHAKNDSRESVASTLLAVLDDLETSKARRASAEAQLAELKLAEKQGRLIDAEAVRSAAFNAGRLVRDRLLRLADNTPSKLAGLPVDRIRAVLRGEVAAIVEAMQQGLARLECADVSAEEVEAAFDAIEAPDTL